VMSMRTRLVAVGASEPSPLSQSVNVMVSLFIWSKSLEVKWSVVACGLG
jgi:hypothetical protein